MIKIEITESSEGHAIGIYDYLFDEIFIGRSKKCDLIFDEKDLPLCYLTLTISEKNLIIKSSKGSASFLLNGKKTQGVAKLKPKDIIKFSNHEIKILEYLKTSTSVDLTPFYEKIPESAPEIQAALTTLENALIEMEKDSNV